MQPFPSLCALWFFFLTTEVTEKPRRLVHVLIRISRQLICGALSLVIGQSFLPVRLLAQSPLSEKGLRAAERNSYPELSLDGRPFFPHSAIFFYYRTPRSRWAATLDAYRWLGINIKVRLPRVHRAEGDTGLEIGWKDEAQATIEMKNFSAMIRLRFSPLAPGGPAGHYRLRYSIGAVGVTQQ